MQKFTLEGIIKKYNEIITIPTGSKILDRMLKGGFKTTTINEIYGEAGSGKTQLIHQILIQACLTLKNNIYLIDNDGTFRPERLIEIGKRFKEFDLQVLKRIYVSKPLTFEEFKINLLQLLKLKEKFNFLAIDSFVKHFRFYPRKDYFNSLREIIKILRKISFKNVCILITNQVTLKEINEKEKFIFSLGGKLLEDTLTTRIKLEKEINRIICKIEIFPEPLLFEKEKFIINKRGFLGLREKYE